MTLEELVDLNGHIALIDADVRGTSKSETELVAVWRIGKRADYHRSEKADDKRLHIIQLPIHCRDDGAASYQFGQVMKNIPKELRKLEVMSWSCGHEYPAPPGCHDYQHLRVDLLSDEYVRLMAKQSRARELQAADDRQLSA